MDRPEHEDEDEDEAGDRTDELSSINSMMSTVMNVGQINGVDSEPTKTSPRSTTKSPSVNRTGRRNQVWHSLYVSRSGCYYLLWKLVSPLGIHNGILSTWIGTKTKAVSEITYFLSRYFYWVSNYFVMCV